MTKLLYIPEGRYIELRRLYTAEDLYNLLINNKVSNSAFLAARQLPIDHKFSKEEFELIYD